MAGFKPLNSVPGAEGSRGWVITVRPRSQRPASASETQGSTIKPNGQSSPGSMGNNLGGVTSKTSPNGTVKDGRPTESTNPPVKSENPAERSYLQRAAEIYEKGNIAALETGKKSLLGGVDVAVQYMGGGTIAQGVGAVGKGAIDFLFPTNVLDFVPVGKLAKGAALLGRGAGKALGTVERNAAENLVENAGEKTLKNAADQGAKDAGKNTAKVGGGGSSNGGYVKRKRKGPCDHLKKGNPQGGGDFRGGSYGGTKAPGIESHHAPADSISPLQRSQGPAIQMTQIDHAETMSHGTNGIDGKNYRAKVQALINQGKWRDAMATEIRDIRQLARESGDPKKYNQAVKEMLAYFKCLERHKLLP